MSESSDRSRASTRKPGRAVPAPSPDALGDGDASPAENETAAAETAAAETAAAETAETAETAAGDDGAAVQPGPSLDGGRSSREATCPYLRLATPDGTLGHPRHVVTDGHRCIAMGDAAPLSERQQSLVCLTASHRDCPRYLRAIQVVPVTDPMVSARGRVRPATLIAIVLLAASTVMAVAFTAARGGISMPVASQTAQPSSSPVAAASATPVTTPSSMASPSGSVAPSAQPSRTPRPSPSATPSATPTPTPARTATPRPSSDRYELLVPCPDKPDCFIYTVRSGDNLVSIANYFGVPLATVYRLNPWARTTGLKAGQELILPPPTR